MVEVDSKLKKLFDDPITQTILKILLNHPEGANLAWIATVCRKKAGIPDDSDEAKAFYYKVYRRVKALEKVGIVKSDSPKHSPYKIIKLNASCAKHVINLTITPDPCVSQTRKTLAKKDPEKILRIDPDNPNLPFAISTRIKALQMLIRNKTLDQDLKRELIDLFKSYIDDVMEKRIILIPKEEYRDDLDPLILPYEVRFTSKRKKKEYERQYRHVWNVTAKKYRWAVMITLTLDPSLITSIWEARYLAQEQFNRFMSNLRRFLRNRAKKYGRTGVKYPYVRFIEYQTNGRVHYHVIIFGTRWIMNENEIAKRWWKIGFVDVQTLVNVKGKWRFKSKPKDYDERYRRFRQRKNKTATDGGTTLHASPEVYFYFANAYSGIESSEDLEGFDDYDLLNMALHWALNTRFFTISKTLKAPKRKKASSECYEFFASVYELEILTILEYLERRFGYDVEVMVCDTFGSTGENRRRGIIS